MPKPTIADLEAALAEVNATHKIYMQKIANMMALAKAALASGVKDG